MRSVLRPAALLALVCTGLGCAGPEEAPEVHLDRSVCARCGMLVSELTSAAALRSEDGEVRTYDDLVCLLADLDETEASADAGWAAERASIWVYGRESGEALPVFRAAFVRSPLLRTPMGGGIVALADLGAATHLAGSTRGSVLDWTALRADALASDVPARPGGGR